MKAARHARILDIVEKEVIETQELLADRLRELGFKVTQATVSRDIKELRLSKVLSQDGRYKYATIQEAESALANRFIRMFGETVLSIAANKSLIVVRTITGSAGIAAEAIDALKWDEILGTLAGDNTVFVAVRDGVDTHEFMIRLKNLLR